MVALVTELNPVRRILSKHRRVFVFVKSWHDFSSPWNVSGLAAREKFPSFAGTRGLSSVYGGPEIRRVLCEWKLILRSLRLTIISLLTWRCLRPRPGSPYCCWNASPPAPAPAGCPGPSPGHGRPWSCEVWPGHQSASPAGPAEQSVFSSLRPGVLQRIWVNHGDNIMLPGSLITVLLHSYNKKLPRLSLENLCLRQTFSPRRDKTNYPSGYFVGN